MENASYRKIAAIVAAVFVLALAGACSTVKTGSHLDETTNFGAYETFSWIADDPHIGPDGEMTVSPLTHAKIRQAVYEQLVIHGYTFTEDRDAADFVVSYTVGSREKIRTGSYPVAYRGDWGWHVHGSHYYVQEYVEHSYTQGTLSVDVFDKETRKPVWHGWAQKSITEDDRRDPTETINEGVRRLFESFPRNER